MTCNVDIEVSGSVDLLADGGCAKALEIYLQRRFDEALPRHFCRALDVPN